MTENIGKCQKTGKTIMQSKKQAEKFCEGKELRAYYCEFCNGYHVTKRQDFNIYTNNLKHLEDFKKYM